MGEVSDSVRCCLKLESRGVDLHFSEGWCVTSRHCNGDVLARASLLHWTDGVCTSEV